MLERNAEMQDGCDSLAAFLLRNRSGIIHQWIRRLRSEVDQRYSRRSMDELNETVSEAFDANFQVLIHDSYDAIDGFIDKITRLRLQSGFPLSAVQKAFELFREVSLPLLAAEAPPGAFTGHILNINRCLAYTIHRFSDHFQDMHQKRILEHNRLLEETVRNRTAALEESERKYKTLVEEINDGYVVIQDERIVFANRAFCRMHGYAEDRVPGMRFFDLVEPAGRGRVLDFYRRGMERKTAPRVFEYNRMTRSGDTFPTEIQAKITYYDDRLSSIGLCRDITERVMMERRVRENERMAYIGQITTSLSHEIRNPLSAVKLNLQILKKNPLIAGNDQRRITISVDEVNRLERILNQLLNFAKPVQLTPVPLALNTVVSDFAELLETKFDEKELCVETRFDGAIPTVRADREKVGQLMINLLLNAIEASEPSSLISLGTRWIDDRTPRVEIFVKDQGHGYPEALSGELFKPFVTTRSKGTGLGLANAWRIAEAHGGWIRCRNRKPRGAAFTVSLPVEKSHGQSSRRR